MELIVYHCGETYRTDSSNIGKKIRCVKCGEVFAIEAAGAAGKVRSQQTQTIFANEVGSTGTSPSGEPHPESNVRRQSAHWLPYAYGIVFALCLLILVFKLNNTPQQPVIARYSDSPTTPVNALPHEPERSAVPAADTSRARQPMPEKQPSPQTPSSLATEPPRLTQPDLPTRSLPNGTDIIEPLGLTGHNKLTLRNGPEYDAYVLIAGDGVAAQKYITRGNTVVIDNLSPCTCEVIFATGIDWNGDGFSRNESRMKFVAPLVFSATETNDGTTYGNHTVTLYTVFNGNARTVNISKEEFQKALLRVRQGQLEGR
jgi:hypothetical protein